MLCSRCKNVFFQIWVMSKSNGLSSGPLTKKMDWLQRLMYVKLFHFLIYSKKPILRACRNLPIESTWITRVHNKYLSKQFIVCFWLFFRSWFVHIAKQKSGKVRAQKTTCMHFDLHRFRKLKRRRKCCCGKHQMQKHPLEVPWPPPGKPWSKQGFTSIADGWCVDLWW